ncbi:MAG: hypothetical protein ABI620_08130 [Chloroflexota bacterium]
MTASGVTVGEGLAVGVGVVVGAGVGVGVGLGVELGVEVGAAVLVGTGVSVGAALGSTVEVGLGVAVGSADGTVVAVGPGVLVGAAVGADVGLGVEDALGAGTGGAASDCGFGEAWLNQSVELAFVSIVLPPRPPGFRSMLAPAAGAPIDEPSTKEFVASPQPTASIGAPPIGRRTIAPPVAAKPPLYVASASPAKIPEVLPTSRCCPGSRRVPLAHEAFRVTVLPVEVT